MTDVLPLLSGRTVSQAFVRLGWRVARGTLRSLLRAAGVDPADFLKAAE